MIQTTQTLASGSMIAISICSKDIRLGLHFIARRYAALNYAAISWPVDV